MKRSADGSEKDRRIRLNVGGRHLETRKNVLCSIEGTMLERMFGGDIPAVPDDDGSYFFDRDGKIFEDIILPYLRCVADGIEIDIRPDAKRFHVKREFDFFGIPHLSNVLDGIDAVQLAPSQIVRAGFTSISRATINNNLLIIQTKDVKTDLLKIFDMENYEQQGVAFIGSISSSGTTTINGKLFCITDGYLNCHDLLNTEFDVPKEFATPGLCSEFVCVKELVISFNRHCETPLTVYDICGRELGQADNFTGGRCGGSYVNIENMLFDEHNILYILQSKDIFVYRANFTEIGKSKNDLTKEPFLRLIHSIKLSIPIVSSVMCESILCTATAKMIQMWDNTDFEENRGKKFSFGLGKVKAIVAMGTYIIASTGECGDKLKIYNKDVSTMVDKIILENDVTSFNANGKHLLIGRQYGNLDVLKC